MIRKTSAMALTDWVAKALALGDWDPANLVVGPRSDAAAVRAAVTEAWSDGPVEDHVGRLKGIERQMFGRAGMKLSRVRVRHNGEPPGRKQKTPRRPGGEDLHDSAGEPGVLADYREAESSNVQTTRTDFAEEPRLGRRSHRRRTRRAAGATMFSANPFGWVVGAGTAIPPDRPAFAHLTPPNQRLRGKRGYSDRAGASAGLQVLPRRPVRGPHADELGDRGDDELEFAVAAHLENSQLHAALAGVLPALHALGTVENQVSLAAAPAGHDGEVPAWFLRSMTPSPSANRWSLKSGSSSS